MRIAVPIAISTAVPAIALCGALVAGCSPGTPTRPGATQLTPITRPHTSERTTTPTRTSMTTSSPSTTAATAAPGPEATASAAVAWVEAAAPADAASFHVALRAGSTAQLGEDVAFTAASGTSCMTDLKRDSAGLACLVDLTDPPAQPPDTYGVWKGGWVDFNGTDVRVGSAHGDPGRFTLGQGTPLPADRSLSFGDFRCRADTDALICINYARQSAVRYAESGIEAYGCTRQSPPAAGTGIEFRC